MISVRVATPDGQGLPAVMLYAIATHPKYQGRGLATQVMDFCDRYLIDDHKEMSILVPATDRLFDFYSKRGYIDGFNIREVVLTDEVIEGLIKSHRPPALITPTTPCAYNRRRNKQLQGRFYVAYGDEEIAYQKKLSIRSGADIYAMDMEGIHGCAAVERISPGKVFFKELLMPEHLILRAAAQLAKRLPAKEYILRTPAYLCEHFEGTVRPFGMVKPYRMPDVDMAIKEPGYLGIAYD